MIARLSIALVLLVPDFCTATSRAEDAAPFVVSLLQGFDPLASAPTDLPSISGTTTVRSHERGFVLEIAGNHFEAACLIVRSMFGEFRSTTRDSDLGILEASFSRERFWGGVVYTPDLNQTSIFCMGGRLPEHEPPKPQDVQDSPALRIDGDLPEYPFGEKLQEGGKVVVDFHVDRYGRVGIVTVVEATDDTLARLVCLAVKTWKFRPAFHGGEPIEANYRQAFRFAPTTMIQNAEPGATANPDPVRRTSRRSPKLGHP